MQRNVNTSAMGGFGGNLISDASEVNIRHSGFLVVEDATLSFSIRCTGADSVVVVKAIPSQAYTAGMEIVGDIRLLTVTGGKVFAYYQENAAPANV